MCSASTSSTEGRVGASAARSAKSFGPRDTPWHVSQPQGEPLDLGKTNDEIVAATRARFEAEPGFGSIDEFYEARADHLSAN